MLYLGLDGCSEVRRVVDAIGEETICFAGLEVVLGLELVDGSD